MPYDFRVPTPKVAGPLDRYQNVLALEQMRNQNRANALAIQTAEETAGREAALRNALAPENAYDTPEARSQAIMSADPIAGGELLRQDEIDRRAARQAGQEATEGDIALLGNALNIALGVPADQPEQRRDVIRTIMADSSLDETLIDDDTAMDDEALRGVLDRMRPAGGLMSVPSTSRLVNERTGEVVLPAEVSGENVPASIQEYRMWADQQEPGADRTFEEYLKRRAAATAAPKEAERPYGLADIRNLHEDWLEVTAPARDIDQQLLRMEAGLDAVRAGDASSGSQAVLVTFQKILDPTSVVRESEYARSASGLSLLDQLAGYLERIEVGGAGVPLPELEGFVRTAKSIVGRLNNEYVQDERKRLSGVAKEFDIPEHLIFESAGPDVGATAAGAPAAGESGGTFSVGDIVVQDGRQYRITSINPLQGEPID